MSEQIVFIVLLVPLAWSAAVAGLRRLATGKAAPDDATEKYQLLIMVTPILLGAAWMVLSRFMPVHLPLPLPLPDNGAAVEAPQHIAATVAAPARATFDPMPWLTDAVLVAWTTVAVIRTTPLVTALVRLSHIVTRAGQSEIEGVPVRLTEASVPPLAWGRASVVLPMRLTAKVEIADLRLIVRHEQAHLRRGDPFYFTALGVIDAILWFNPFVLAQTRRCRLAAELACDAMASGENALERETYARVLIKTLKYADADSPKTPMLAAMANTQPGDYRMRLQEIMKAAPTAHKGRGLWLAIALTAALMPVAFVQFAWAQGGAPSVAGLRAAAVAKGSPASTAPVSRDAGARLQSPVDAAITHHFGFFSDPDKGTSHFHQGVDYAAAIGTPVRAPADGRVTAVYNWPKTYGKTIEIDHGNGLKTRLAHLDTQKVAVGDIVKAGQVIGTTGDTGGTGEDIAPHLHFEVWKNNKVINPMKVLPANAG